MGCTNTIDLPAGPVPCGNCFDCRLTRQRMLTVRLVCESQMHENNYFVTMTYDNEHYPANVGRAKKDIKSFIQKLERHVGHKVRIYSIIEAGEKNGRLHHHLMMFGVSINDVHELMAGGDFDSLPVTGERERPRTWFSQEMSDFWGRGRVEVGRCEVGSCAYVAAYCQKKIGDKGGAVCRPRFPRMPPLGGEWVIQYFMDIINHGKIVLPGGIIMPIPRQFLTDKFLYPEELEQVRAMKAEYSKSNYSNLSHEDLLNRSIARQEHQEARAALYRGPSI